MSVVLHHRVEGPADAPVLVLANSLGTSLMMWDPVVTLLADSFRIIRYDHRGQGDSPVPPPPYQIDQLGTDVLALLDRLGLDSVAFAGVSIGAMVGLWLAASAAERISALAVFCGSAHPGNPDAWRLRAATVREAGSTAPVADAVVDLWLTAAFASAHPEIRAALLAMLHASPPLGYAALAEMLAELDLRPLLGRIRAPTLVVTGAQDQALAPEHGELISLSVPSTARYVELDPAAHIPMVQRPETVAALIREHLEVLFA